MRTCVRSYLFLFFFLGVTSCTPTRLGVAEEGVAPKQPVEEAWLFDAILFEIAPITSAHEPDPAALEIFRERLHENHLCPRTGVHFLVHKADPVFPFVDGMPWNTGMLGVFEAQRRLLYDANPEDRQLIVFVPYLSGLWLDGNGIKLLGGLQYSPTAFALFRTGAGNREAGVLLHEFGHLIGLVKDEKQSNNDAKHPNHCSNERCVMYWSTSGPLADFDADCKRYLRGLILQRNRKSK